MNNSNFYLKNVHLNVYTSEIRHTKYLAIFLIIYEFDTVFLPVTLAQKG